MKRTTLRDSLLRLVDLRRVVQPNDDGVRRLERRVVAVLERGANRLPASLELDVVQHKAPVFVWLLADPHVCKRKERRGGRKKEILLLK